MMRKSLLTKLSAVVLASAILVACGGNAGSESGTTAANNSATADTAKETMNAQTETIPERIAEGLETIDGKLVETDSLSGLKLTDEPVTLTIGYRANAALDKFSECYYFDELSEKTGVNFEFVEYADAAAVTAMFASRDYPDILLYGATDDLLFDAAEAGDIIRLDDYLPEYAPYTNQFYSENPYFRASITATDGHVYSLPYVGQAPHELYPTFWFINTKWLDELGLDKPTTMTEFHDALKAIKDHAGEGSIPANVVPFYMYMFDNQKGMSDLINCFGTYVSFGNYWAMLSEDGKVMYNWINPDIKEALEYMHGLIEEGLLSLDGFTDDADTATAKTAFSTEDMIGSFFAIYAYGEYGNGTMEAMLPLDAGNGKTPKYKVLPPRMTRNRFSIYKNCENVELAVELAEVMGREYFSATAISGPNGGGWEYVEGGNIADVAPYDYKTISSSVPARISKEVWAKYEIGSGDNLAAQTKTRIKNGAMCMSADAYLPQTMIYPDFMKAPETSARLSELNTDIQNCIKTTFADWLINGGIEEGWDAYVEQMNSIGVQEFLDLLQQEYDRFAANTVQ